jgi:hypothetical protein
MSRANDLGGDSFEQKKIISTFKDIIIENDKR